MKLYEIVFSATGRTKKVADIVSSVFEGNKTKIDLSNPNFDKYKIEKDSACIVAVPVYNGRVPAPAVDRLKKIEGNGATAILISVYGNRAIDDCLLELKDTLTEQNFKCKAAIKAVAEHSMMPQFATNRPDEEDKKELLLFAKKIKEKIENNSLNDDIEVPGKRPYVKSPNLPIKIKTNKECIKCGACAKACPVKAISFDNPSCTDKSKCITCMRCITVCPKKARSLPSVLLSIVGTVGKSQFKGRKANTLYL